MSDVILLNILSKKFENFKKESKKILSKQETSKSRIISLDSSYKKLSELSLKQDELLRQSLRCVEEELFRAAHVMSWASFMDFIEDKIMEKIGNLKKIRPKWGIKDITDLRENVPEYQIISVLKDLNICSKNEVKAFHGLLNKRNECAHPSDYFPDLNQSLGYISEIIGRIKKLQ
ncbi:hypothetical protein GOV13_00920 [Candidatus Pacearchaeota archaeon]|nr:hypothetical protein [Candidatus Pacearchaeota archaeon]